jgi:hypothetical protein
MALTLSFHIAAVDVAGQDTYRILFLHGVGIRANIRDK